jgi:hypothetical protein
VGGKQNGLEKLAQCSLKLEFICGRSVAIRAMNIMETGALFRMAAMMRFL